MIIGLGYPDYENWQDGRQWRDLAKEHKWTIKWKLYADSMPCKQGEKNSWDLPMLNFNQFVK